jgi:histone-lysine N-methyltransferase SETMAR
MFRNHLKEAIRRKRRGLLSSGVCLQRHNNRLHTARHTVQQIRDLNLAVLRHPPYSTDLALSDFHFFWALKDAVLGRHIRSDEEVKKAV